MDPEKEDSFDMNLNKEFIWGDGFPLSTKGSISRSNKSPAAICWQGLLMYSVYWEQPQTEILASHTMACLVTLNQPLQGSLGFIFWPLDWDLPCPIRIAQLYPHLHLYQAELFYNNQSEPMIPTNQQHNSDQSELCEFGNLICINGAGGACSIKGGLPFVLVVCTFSFYKRLGFSGLQTISSE